MNQRISSILLAAIVLFAALSVKIKAVSPLDYALCDVEVLYVYDNAEKIDWPTIYYLNDNYGCRIDLVRLTDRTRYFHESRELTERHIYLHTYGFPLENRAWADSLAAKIFSRRRPDIVIFGDIVPKSPAVKFRDYLLKSSAAPDQIFDILKIYQFQQSEGTTAKAGDEIVVNGRELQNRYGDRLDAEVPFFFDWYRSEEFIPDRLTHYKVLRNTTATGTAEADFLSGIESNRTEELSEQMPTAGPIRENWLREGRKFVTSFNAARQSKGAKKVGHIILGYRELLTMQQQFAALQSQIPFKDYRQYLIDLVARGKAAVLDAVGVEWDGQIVLRDSPHGPKLKFIANLSANGPEAVHLNALTFYPYWDSSAVVLDQDAVTVTPHQSYQKEYIIDIDRDRLESNLADSLLFSATITYGQLQIKLYNSLPVHPAPELSLAFEPDFTFLPPVSRLNVDRVVSSMNWKVVISKPYSYSGNVKISLETPEGLFAGAYKQELMLDKGNTRETVRIPFTVSQLFELGIQQQKVGLLVDNREIASAVGRVRIAACDIADDISLGFMPDETGLLEDILRQTNAAFRPLTDRTLQTGDLDAYHGIVIGSGSFRNFPSLRKTKDRLLDYIRGGGSLILLGQPEDWPEGILPVSFIPSVDELRLSDIMTRLPKARVLSQPYAIDQDALLHNFENPRLTQAASVSPAEIVFVTPDGRSLLSVSRIGDGQLIFCGLPLLELISELDLEAIHLLANILNY